MSLLRDSPPGSKIENLVQNDGDTKINGGFAIGFQNGQLVDQFEAGIIDQGLASAFFHSSTRQGTKEVTSHLNFRLEPERIHQSGNDYGINLYYKDSELGDISAYTYKKRSIDDSVKYLANFANNPNNSQHVLYAYVSKILPILNMISGTTPLGASSSREVAKRAVFGNLATFSNLITFPTQPEYDELLNNFTTNPSAFHGLENVIYFKLDLSSVDPSYKEPFLVSVDFNGTATSFINIRIHNLPWQNKFASFDIGIIKAYDDNGIFQINKARLNNFVLELNNKNDLNTKGYFDLVDLPILMEVGINTTKAMTYHFIGELKVPIPIISFYNLDFFIEVQDTINEQTGLLNVLCYIKIDYPGQLWYKKFYSELFVKENVIYYKKVNLRSKGLCDVEYFKVTSNDLIKDIAYYIFMYMLENDTIYGEIEKGTSITPSTKPLDFLTSFNHETTNDPGKNQFKLNVYGKILGPFPLDGDIFIEYDPRTKELIGLYSDISVATIVNLKIDLDIKHDGYAPNYRDAYNSFMICFQNNPNTRNLDFRTDPKNPNDNVFKVTGYANYKGDVLGESNTIPNQFPSK